MNLFINLVGVLGAAFGILLFVEVVLESYHKPLPKLTASQKWRIFAGMVLVFIGFKLNELLLMLGLTSL